MSNVVNLNRVRKKKARAEKEGSAEINRAKFGRTKAEKKISEAKRAKRDRDLDGHELGDDA